MLKQLAKIRRFRKKKDKGSSADKLDSPFENSVENSDDQNSEVGSNAGERLSSNSLNPSASCKSFDNDIDETRDTGCDTMASIPTMASSEESILDDPSDSEDEDEVDFSIPINDLKNVYATKHADEDRLFREEMKNLSSYVSKHPSTCEYAKLPQNKDKNRYKNIVTSDKARVILKRIDDDPFSDYINASYIDGFKKKRKFIATQGPKPGTVNDFWRMVWEQQIHVIVMVTDYRENGKVKCERYFSENSVEQYGNIFVECKNTCSHGDYSQTTLEIRYSEEEVFENDDGNNEEDADREVRTIVHLQCKRWPDHGVPKTTSSIYRLYKKMLELQPKETDSPLLIHCSAGVGRTGTLIGLDILIERLQSEQTVNVHDAVVEMRRQRTEMVQGLDQYVLLHKLILEHHNFKDTDYTVAEFEERMKETEGNDPEQEVTTFESEFELLSLILPQNARFGSGSLPQNEDKNRDSKVVPYEHSQVFIRMKPTEMRPPYVNASPLLSYDGSIEIIATQAPLSSSIEDFWRVVLDNNVTCIVMLTPLSVDDVESCPQYWPSDGDVEFGDITIHLEESIDHTNYAETNLSVTANDREKVMKPVTHIQYGSWLDNAPIPENCDSVLLEMIAHVDRHVKRQDTNQERDGRPKTRVVVHCSDGAGRTGVFCTVLNLIQRLKSENQIDVFRTVKDLRDCRPQMVRTTSQYEFCHRTIATYLRSFDLYKNGT